MRSLSRLGLVSVGWLVWLGPLPAALQDLPAESELPGRSAARRDLPPESALPRPADSPPAAGRSPRVELPSEAALPPVMAAESRREPAAEGDHRARELASALDPTGGGNEPGVDAVPAEPERPWLRLLLNGPTAPLHALQFTADSRRLLAGGDDKALHIWQLLHEVEGLPATWTYDHAIAWQVQRGARGALRAIAADAQSIVFAGIGATPLTGEIARVDPHTMRWDRCWYDLQQGSQAAIVGLAMLGPGACAALDLRGQVVLWRREAQTGLWGVQPLRSADAARFPPAAAETLARFRRLGSTLAGSDQGYVVWAEPVPADQPRNPPQWQIVRRELASGNETTLAAPQPHAGSVPALALAADGQRIVSADLTDAGRWFRWDLARGPNATVAQFQFPIRSLALARSGKWLLIGTGLNAAGTSQASLFRWEPNGDLRPVQSWTYDRPVLACCLSPDEQWLAYTVGTTVQLHRLEQPAAEPLQLAGIPSPVQQIAFAAEREHPYRLTMQCRSAEPGAAAALEAWTFDPQNPGLVDAELNADDFPRAANPQPERWQLQADVDSRSGQTTWQVVVGGRTWGRLPLDSNADGFVTASCWLASDQDPKQPLGLVVGTNKNHHLYLYRVTAEEGVTLLRQYRGHEGAVRSLAVAQDQRYLASAADDSTIRFWKLDDALRAPAAGAASQDAWGAQFRVAGEQLLAQEVVADGPLYFRGLRNGDQVVAIAWTPGETGVEQRVVDPAAILAELRRPDWRRMLRFEVARGGLAQAPFYLHPAWQPLAALLVTADREWAFWSPYGFYDASFNGHQRFGWQFNRGIEREPDWFRAAELQESLERPELLRQLLSQGSIEGAFQALRQTPPAGLHTRLASEQRLRPRIEIISPQPDSESEPGTRLTIRARIEVPPGVRLGTAKAFVNGVPASHAPRGETAAAGESQRREWRWEIEPPRDRRLRVQIVAVSDQGNSAVAQCDLRQRPASTAAGDAPRVFLLAAGVGNYRDGQIPPLAFAENNVRAVRQVLSGPAASPATPQPTLLLGGTASRTLWRAATAQTVAAVRAAARPDDLVVLFLSGHGVSDPQTGEYFFVTPSARYGDLMARRYGDCISLEEFEPFAALPCRKLVILDTCESGTALPGKQRADLKPLVRWLESDMFFTLTSAEGSADAYESAEDRLSFFTASLVRGLQGAADAPDRTGQRDGQVEWRELARYVMDQVPAAIARVGKQQYPSAAPKELLEFAEIPLVRVAPRE